jgi:tetratricopeptide (TPR) repeat protein
LKEAESTYGKQSTNYGLSLNAIGFLSMSTGSLAAADTYYSQAIAIISKDLGPSSLQLATPYANQTQLYLLQANRVLSHSEESIAFLKQAEASSQKLLALMEKNYTGADPVLVQPLEGLAYVLVQEKDLGGAKLVLLRALSLETGSLPPDHLQIIRTRNSLAWILNAIGDKSGAVEQYRQALVSAQKTLGPQDPFTAGIRDVLKALQGPSGP